MDRLTQVLKAADPLVQEPSLVDSDRERILSAVLNAGSPAVVVSAPRVPMRWMSIGVLLLLLIAAVAFQVRSASTHLLAAVRFEIRLAEDQPRPGLTVAQVGANGRLVYLYPDAVIDNADIGQAWVVDEGHDNQFGVAIQLVPSGAAKMREATATHIGRPLAIMVDGDVVAAPTVRSVVTDMASITGDYTKADAERLAAGVVPR